MASACSIRSGQYLQIELRDAAGQVRMNIATGNDQEPHLAFPITLHTLRMRSLVRGEMFQFSRGSRIREEATIEPWRG